MKRAVPEAPGTAAVVPPAKRLLESNGPRSEFSVAHLENFYKACPSYRLPQEVGSFSLDARGRTVLDRSGLRQYVNPQNLGRLNFDLGVGFESFVPAENNKSVPTNGLAPVLKWISLNGDQFVPKSNPKSPTENGGPPAHPLDPEDRPDNLLTNFITWRGMLTRIMCSPYDKGQPWKVSLTLYKGSIYLSEVETEECKQRRMEESQREKEMCYWGVKFEDYVTSRGDKSSQDKSGTVNAQEGFCSVVRTRMNTHSIVMAGEVDCYDTTSREKPPNNYIELKTCRILYTDRNQASFRKYKMMKWWAQSYLIGVPRIICGFRDDSGIVKNLRTFKTAELPHDTQVDLTLWQPSVCLNFLDELLTWIRKVVVKDDPSVVYLMEWNKPFTHVTVLERPPNSEHVFLPQWYMNKLPPPLNR